MTIHRLELDGEELSNIGAAAVPDLYKKLFGQLLRRLISTRVEWR